MNPFAYDKTGRATRGMDDDLIKDLERQSLEQIRKLRKHQRVELRLSVRLRPGNASAEYWQLDGKTADISSGGCRVNFTRPVGVGDVYRLNFNDEHIDVPMVYARCLRCSFVREDVFEAGFAFFSSIAVTVGSEQQDPDLLD